MTAAGGIDNVDFNVGVVVARGAALRGRGDEGHRQRRHAQPPVAVRCAEGGDTFDAEGIIGADRRRRQHAGARCIVMTQIKDGKFVRTYPKKPARSTATRRTSSTSSWTSADPDELVHELGHPTVEPPGSTVVVEHVVVAADELDRPAGVALRMKTTSLTADASCSFQSVTSVLSTR